MSSKTTHSTASSSSATPFVCPFVSSESLVTDGGFEDDKNPFTREQGSSENIQSSVLPSSLSPVADSTLCGYFLQVAFVDGAQANTAVFQYTIPTIQGRFYSLGFQHFMRTSPLVPPGLFKRVSPAVSEATWSVTAGGITIGEGNNENNAAWANTTGVFQAKGDDLIEIHITAQYVSGAVSFDNFIVTPSDMAEPLSSHSSTTTSKTRSRTSVGPSSTKSPFPTSSSAPLSPSTTSATVCSYSTPPPIVTDGSFQDGQNPFSTETAYAAGPSGLAEAYVEAESYAAVSNLGPDTNMLTIELTQAAIVELYMPLTLVAGQQYEASFYALTCTEKPSGQIIWSVFAADTTIGSRSSSSCAAWTLYSSVFTAQSYASDLVIQVLAPDGQGGLSLYLENFQVTPVSAPVNPCIGSTPPQTTSPSSSAMASSSTTQAPSSASSSIYVPPPLPPPEITTVL